MKTCKSTLFKKYLKKRKLRTSFYLSLGWLHINEKNLWKPGIMQVQKLIQKCTPGPQNGQTHSSNSSGIADEMFECV